MNSIQTSFISLTAMILSSSLALACQPKGCVDPHPLPNPTPICRTKCMPTSQELSSTMADILGSDLRNTADLSFDIQENDLDESVTEYRARVQMQTSTSCEVRLLTMFARGQEFELTHSVVCE